MGCVSFTFLLCDLPRQTPQGAATAKAETQYTVFRYMYVYMYCTSRWHCDAYPREANRGLLLVGAECHHARNGETSIGRLSLASLHSNRVLPRHEHCPRLRDDPFWRRHLARQSGPRVVQCRVLPLPLIQRERRRRASLRAVGYAAADIAVAAAALILDRDRRVWKTEELVPKRVALPAAADVIECLTG